jgi:hypothetical protein
MHEKDTAREGCCFREATLAGPLWLVPVILPTWEADVRRIAILSQLGQIFREIYLKNTQQKRKTGGEAQVVQFLPNKCETMSANPKFCQRNRTF